MKKLFVLITVFVLLAFSCDSGGLGSSDKQRHFYAYDIVNNTQYRIVANLLAENNLCEIWVENGLSITAAQAGAIANTYRNTIYPKMADALFWEVEFDDVGYVNTMQFASLLTGGNGKLIILILDIRCGSVGLSSVAGYFAPWHFYDQAGSNKANMVFMGHHLVGTQDFHITLAHEMQHLMNFVTSLLLVYNDSRPGLMETWIDEGLSEATEWIVFGTQNQDRVNWYNNDPTGLIAQGDTFYVWQNYDDLDPDAVMNDYATVNIFFQWFRMMTNNNIYRNILFAPFSDYRALSELLDGVTWAEIMEDWHLANFINHPYNAHGYRNDSVLKNIKAHYLWYDDDFQFPLAPGEAVYTYLQSGSFNTNISSANIGYAGIASNKEIVQNISAGGTLLTFSKSTINSKNTFHHGYITGQLPPSTSVLSSVRDNRSLTSRSYNISAADMLRRRGIVNNHFDTLSMPDKNEFRKRFSFSPGTEGLRPYNKLGIYTEQLFPADSRYTLR
jgi:hypothetical protein